MVPAMAIKALLPGSTFQDCEVCPEMVVIPAGSIRIGAPFAEGGDDEWPIHNVVISRLFAVGKYEVTRFEFAMFVEATKYSIDFSCRYLAEVGWEAGVSWRNPGFRQTNRDPVVCVNWDDAKAYVAWLSQKTGMSYRLPSESEWEYAARAGGLDRYFYGDSVTMLCKYGNGVDASSDFKWRNRTCKDDYGTGTAPVGSFLPNKFGLYDTIGNVWEWIEDCWNEDYFGAPADGTSWNTGDCSNRGTRGGSWLNDPRFLRSAHRNRLFNGYRKNNTGFRVVREIVD
jgi:formylglycine-generating enzyme required for sulfatase activity